MATSILSRTLRKTALSGKLQCLAPSTSSVRHLNLLEYQSKDLLDKHGVTVQKFKMAESASQAREVIQEFKPAEYVVKAQILAGGRGKGSFDNGFKGGVHLTKQAEDVPTLVESMAGHRLTTKQTPSGGILVRKVMVAESVDILRETYFCILMDREHSGAVIIASPDGGVDIEEVAEKTPDRLRTLPVDIHEGVTRQTAEELAVFLGFHGDLKDKAAQEIEALWGLFLAVDATQVEINPFIETPQGKVVAVDAKIQFDDNAEFRQRAIFAAEDTSESDPREVEAASHNLNYIGMDGNIGCLVNGAGLAMATMDIIKLHGGEPANFLDCGGGVQEEQVKNAFQLLTSDKNVKAILVNVFGGIVNCATIANGIVNASKSISLDLPLVVRLEGTNADEARQILADSRLPIQTAADLEDAAIKAVASL